MYLSAEEFLLTVRDVAVCVKKVWLVLGRPDDYSHPLEPHWLANSHQSKPVPPPKRSPPSSPGEPATTQNEA